MDTKKLQNISNYIVYYIFLPTLTSTQDLARCDTLHIQYRYHCLRQWRTKVTVAQILSRAPRITTTHKKRNKNLSHSYIDMNIWTNTTRGQKHSLRVSWTVVVLGRTVASPRHRPQTWTLDFSVVLSFFFPYRAGNLAWRTCVGIIYEQWTHRGPRSKTSSDWVPEVLAGKTGLVAELLFNPGKGENSLLNWMDL